jgi:hypothetical protein
VENKQTNIKAFLSLKNHHWHQLKTTYHADIERTYFVNPYDYRLKNRRHNQSYNVKAGGCSAKEAHLS